MFIQLLKRKTRKNNFGDWKKKKKPTKIDIPLLLWFSIFSDLKKLHSRGFWFTGQIIRRTVRSQWSLLMATRVIVKLLPTSTAPPTGVGARRRQRPIGSDRAGLVGGPTIPQHVAPAFYKGPALFSLMSDSIISRSPRPIISLLSTSIVILSQELNSDESLPSWVVPAFMKLKSLCWWQDKKARKHKMIPNCKHKWSRWWETGAGRGKDLYKLILIRILRA